LVPVFCKTNPAWNLLEGRSGMCFIGEIGLGFQEVAPESPNWEK